MAYYGTCLWRSYRLQENVGLGFPVLIIIPSQQLREDLLLAEKLRQRLGQLIISLHGLKRVGEGVREGDGSSSSSTEVGRM